jgi:3-methylcrotonyl-CoA carboxylase alpha subunit
VDVGSGAVPVLTWRSDDGLRIELGGTLHRRVVEIDGGALWVSGGERHRRFARVSREEQIEAKESTTRGDPRNLVAPFPGLVTSVEVSPGDAVESGRLLVVMEAMKMVHSLRASGSGAVRAVRCEAGRTVAAGDLLVELEAEAG